jgi:hypothetical protein
MILYLPGSPNKAPGAKHFMSCSPAGHLPREYPDDKWWNCDQVPRTPKAFNLIFENGCLNVEDRGLCEYLLSTGCVTKSRPTFRYLRGVHEEAEEAY